MAGLTFQHVKKRYGLNEFTVKDFHLDVADKEFLVLVGASGCGKSTTLRMVAGLEDISEGQLYIGNRLVNEVEPKDRDIAMVFQNYALYPHMTVYENMAFGLKLRKIPKAQIEARVQETADILGIQHLLSRKPKELSGGQRQRVALGRAIVREPQVFLMDEPLSNLDAKLRVQMRTEIVKLHKRLETTIIYVTHDQTEAMTMADRIVVMHEGVIQQVASPHEIYYAPVNKYVAGFIGSPAMNFIEGRITEEAGEVFFCTGDMSLSVGEEKACLLRTAGYVGKEVIMGVRPEDLDDITELTDGEAVKLTAEVEVVENLGDRTYLYVLAGSHALTACVVGERSRKEGEFVTLFIQMKNVHFFDKVTEQAIR